MYVEHDRRSEPKDAQLADFDHNLLLVIDSETRKDT